MNKSYLYLSAISLSLINCTTVRSQVIPDRTSNTVTIPQENLIQIQEGITRGSNLFHSFQEFSVPTGDTAWFDNAVNIENIFSRVTGGNISQIDGLIRTNGTANLFLLNPAGIIFGQDASLNVGGSFVVSTADSFNFSDGSEFSAINPQEPPLLTVSIPLGLQYGSNPGKIAVRGTGSNLLSDPVTFITIRDERNPGLQVPQGETLALLGGEVALEGGNITAESGKIDVWAVTDNSSLTIAEENQQLQVESSSVPNVYSDINLSQAASIYVSGNSSGDVQIKGKNLSLTGGSSILADVLGDGTGGILSIETTESITISEITDVGNSVFASSVYAEVGSGATGEGSDIIIATGDLSLSDGGIIASTNIGVGTPGEIKVTANNINISEVAVAEGLFTIPSGISSQSGFEGGDGGKITIETDNLLMSNGGVLSTVTFGGGNSGDIAIKANRVELVGESIAGSSSEIAANVFFERGDGGNIDINTKQLIMADGAAISSLSFDVGNGGRIDIRAEEIDLNGANSSNGSATTIDGSVAGTGDGADITIQTKYLRTSDGAAIATGTFGEGNAGDLTINATESIELKRASEETRGGLFTSAILGTGDGGNLVVNTKQLTIEDGATISVSNFQSRNLLPPGEGAAGDLKIQADSIDLERGVITAEANAGNQGNIKINSERVVLRDNSLITTNAMGSATGGDIYLTTDTLTALNNSDITANAVSNFAGRVTIDATGIFGLEFREQLTPFSDITATSELGAEFNGVVQLNTPDVDPASGLDNLADDTLDATAINVASCPSGVENNFVVAGKGGLPENPTQGLRTIAVWNDLRPIVLNKESHSSSATNPIQTETQQQPEQIIEAKGWVIGERGQIILTATPNNSIVRHSAIPTPGCQTKR